MPSNKPLACLVRIPSCKYSIQIDRRERSLSFQERQVHVALTTTEDGQARIAITLGRAGVDSLLLTPSQTKALATDLIAAVSRAEVKANLKVSHNLWRHAGETRSHPLPTG